MVNKFFKGKNNCARFTSELGKLADNRLGRGFKQASKKKFTNNKKGVSSIFIGIYITILAVLLISTLFVGIFVSREGLVKYLKVEQERSQEQLQLYKITTDPSDVFIKSLEVINTGSITMKIKALYVDHKLICDPSDNSILGDKAFVEPKNNVTIPLFPNVEPYILLGSDSLNALWTVTTERGTTSTEKGEDLWGDDGGTAYTPNKFYFGPLMLLFDMFHWQSENGPFMSGWTIPKNTEDVTWRIFLKNVDNRTITLTEDCTFLLVGNDNEPNSYLAWYIDPVRSDMILIPDKLCTIYYSLNKPYSAGGSSPQSITKFSEAITCKNFLVFSGNFTEEDGTKTPLGQTIPFEAVLITGDKMASSVTMLANPVNIRNDAASTSTITVTVTDSGGNPIVDEWVDLYTSGGTLSDTHVKTDESGQVQTILTSTLIPRTVNVFAICQGIVGTCKVNFTPATKLVVTAIPTTLPMNPGVSSSITIQLVDNNNNNISQSGIQITVTLGWSGNANTRPNLTYQGQEAYSPVTTDSTGKAIIILTPTSSTKGGTATLTVTASGLETGGCTVVIG